MRVIKIIIGILLLIGALGSLISFFEQVSTYDTPETIGHLIGLTIVAYLVYLLLKPSKKPNP